MTFLDMSNSPSRFDPRDNVKLSRTYRNLMIVHSSLQGYVSLLLPLDGGGYRWGVCNLFED